MMQTATPSTLSAVLLAAKGGDTIELGPGDYPPIALSKRAFDPPLMIKGRPDAVIASLNLVQCKGVVLDALTVRFKPTATTLSHFSAVRFFQCEGIELRGSSLIGGPAVNGVPQTATALDSTGNVIGLPCGRAVTAQDCKAVTIARNEISKFHTGIVPSNVDGLTITENDITGLRTSPISGGDVDNATIERNHLGGSKPWRFGLPNGDHGDYIHLWTVPARATRAERAGASKGVVIRENALDQDDGQPMLGIYLDDNGLGIGFAGVVIADNLIINAARAAIQLERTTGKVLRNTMVTPTAIAQKNMLPTVMAWAGSAVEVSDNIMGMKPVVGGSPVGVCTDTGNVIVDRPDYAKVFASDWRALPGFAAGPTALRTTMAVAPAPTEPETIEISVRPGQRVIITGAPA